LSHDFGSRYARQPIQASKPRVIAEIFKKIDPKNGPLGWRPGPGKLVQKVEKPCPHYDTTRRKLQSQKEKNVSQSQLEDMSNP